MYFKFEMPILSRESYSCIGELLTRHMQHIEPTDESPTPARFPLEAFPLLHASNQIDFACGFQSVAQAGLS